MFRLTPSEYLSQNEIAAASAVHLDEFNPQLQPRLTWPATPVVARAYLDQLTRSKAVTSERAAAIKAALDHHDKAKLKELAGQLEQAASAAAGRDAARLRSLGDDVEGVAAAPRALTVRPG